MPRASELLPQVLGRRQGFVVHDGQEFYVEETEFVYQGKRRFRYTVIQPVNYRYESWTLEQPMELFDVPPSLSRQSPNVRRIF